MKERPEGQVAISVKGRSEGHALLLKGRPEYRTLSVNGRPEGPVRGGSRGGQKVKVRQEYPDHCQWSGGQKAWTLSMKGRPKVLDSISKGEARRPRPLSVERMPTGVQALSVR